jgi:hypothetical protein
MAMLISWTLLRWIIYMLRTRFFFRTRLGQFIWIVVFPVFSIALLFTTFATNQALASSRELTSLNRASALALQSTATPTPTLQSELAPGQTEPTSVYTFSLATLGYDEITLNSPIDTAQYSFVIPESWLIEADSLLELDLSYGYSQTQAENYPIQFGNLTVKLDNQTLEIFPVAEKELNHYRLHISLPASILASDQFLHVLSLEFDAGLLCQLPHQATLVVHPTSFIRLNYSQRPLTLDLARYPRPFHQQAFTTPDIVRFVLPAKPTSNDATNAIDIAAKLGDLTSNRQVISATTDVDFRRLLSSNPLIDEHLIVLGKPQDNQILPLLNDMVQLPVSLYQRQLELTTQGPIVVVPGDTFTYIFTVTNVLDREVNLSLINPLPPHTELLDCTPKCTENGDNNIVTFNTDKLERGKTLSFSLTLNAADTLTDTLENTVTLTEANLGPINTDTLTSTVVADSSKNGAQISVNASPEGYFFVYDGQAVAEEDGIIQEVLSPWNENRAILIITGLSDEAVRKAGQAMSSETRFPGMNGAVALVKDTLVPSEINDRISTVVEKTLADLGYPDKVLSGQSPTVLDYYFKIPYDWQLTDAATIDLYFNHSQLVDYEKAGLTVLINREPFASLALNEETANDGQLHISLAKANLRVGDLNRLSVQVDLPLSGECVDPSAGGAWLVVKSASKIVLAHDEVSGPDFNLDYFPYPFHIYPSLTNLLFALPDTPNVAEWETALRLAASVGNSAQQKTTVPVAKFSNDLSKGSLADYQIIAISRPSRNNLIQQANTQLPQPFLPGSDEIEQRLDDVVFRLPSGVNLGYLQLIPSPWNESRAFIAVTGTTDQAVEQAAYILTNRPQILKGNLAFIKEETVNTIDTRELTSGGMVVAMATTVSEMAGATPVPATTTPSPTVIPPSSLASPISGVSTSEQASIKTGLPAWLVPLVSINGLLVITIFAFVFWQARHRKI